MYPESFVKIESSSKKISKNLALGDCQIKDDTEKEMYYIHNISKSKSGVDL